MMMNVKPLVRQIPSPIRQILKKTLYEVVPLKYRYSKVFWETYNFLQKSQWWSRERLEEYQIQQMSKLLYYAYEHVPYYRRIFNEYGIKPDDIKNVSDLRKLPYLTKDLLKKYTNEIVGTNLDLNALSLKHTSGTTGKPLQFYEDLSVSQKEMAFIYHQWARIGFKPGDSTVQLRGAIIGNSKLTDYNPKHKTLRLSPKISDKEIAIYYLEEIRKFGGLFLHGYPSIIATFASIIKKETLRVPFALKAILFASEAIYKWERDIAEEVFGCRAFGHYGMAEKTVLAAECEQSHFFHCIPQYGITEIDNETNEIIGTSLLNFANPFIRYRTTDIASNLMDLSCNSCNRDYFPIFEGVEGRLEDFIITPEGIPISPAVITHPFKDFKTIKATQIVQESIDLININIVAWENAATENFKAEASELSQGLSNLVGLDVKIDIHVVDDIPLLKSGKFKWIKSKVSRDSLLKGLE